MSEAPIDKLLARHGPPPRDLNFEELLQCDTNAFIRILPFIDAQELMSVSVLSKLTHHLISKDPVEGKRLIDAIASRLVFLANYEERIPQAMQLYERALALFVQTGNVDKVINTVGQKGLKYEIDGQLVAADAVYEEGTLLLSTMPGYHDAFKLQFLDLQLSRLLARHRWATAVPVVQELILLARKLNNTVKLILYLHHKRNLAQGFGLAREVQEAEAELATLR